MKKSTIPYTVMQLKKMYEKSGILDFDCPIQRRYGMWDDYKKSLLPHSMLIGFVIPSVRPARLRPRHERRGILRTLRLLARRSVTRPRPQRTIRYRAGHRSEDGIPELDEGH